MTHGLVDNDRCYLLALADTLMDAPRTSPEQDNPEGKKYLVLSDTLAKQISERLRAIAS